MEYLYDDGEYFYFMNTENYEQMHLTKELLGDAVNYLIPQLQVAVEFYEGKPISVELPATVDLTVVETEPGLKGATVSNVTKPAKMETGPGGAGAAVHHRRREDPRQHRRRHVSGKSLKGGRPRRFLRSGGRFADPAAARFSSIRAIMGGSFARSFRSAARFIGACDRDQPGG